ncbi:MAG TPA: hypothetical protein VN493_29585 [Thermoanaerobaculia bacterium]|nr:hypothetical protein [Thermoanaerobaculia bacterium]
MPELIHEYSFVYRSEDGIAYVPRAWGEARTDGTWEGWLEFIPAGGAGSTLRTGQETTQPNRDAVAYWASGLEPVYFEGAFARAS